MRQELIHDALNLLDQDLIEAVDRLREGGVREKDAQQSKKLISGHSRWQFRRYAYLAACLCLLVVCAFAVNRFSWKAGSGSEMDTADSVAVPAEAAVVTESTVEEEAMEEETEEAAPVEASIDCGTPVEEEGMQTEGAGISEESKKDMQKELLLPGSYVTVTCHPVGRQQAAAAAEKLSMDSPRVREVVDAFVAALPGARKIPVEEVISSETDTPGDWDRYRLDFALQEGNTVSLWLMEDGYARMEEQAQVLWQVEPEVFEALMEVLNQ